MIRRWIYRNDIEFKRAYARNKNNNKMKKKALITLSIAAVVIVSGYGGMNANKTQLLDNNDLLMQNVEALAKGDYDFPDGYPYTSTCNVSISKNKRCKVEVITCQGGGAGCNEKGCPSHPSK